MFNIHLFRPWAKSIEQGTPEQACHSPCSETFDSVSWARYDFIYFLLIVLCVSLKKDHYFVCLFFPSLPSKPSAFTSLPVTSVLFIVFLSLYFLLIGFG